MDNRKVRNMLESMLESLENPTYRHLEIGFRHTPLTEKEIMERYKETCLYVAMDVKELLNEIGES